MPSNRSLLHGINDRASSCLEGTVTALLAEDELLLQFLTHSVMQENTSFHSVRPSLPALQKEQTHHNGDC